MARPKKAPTEKRTARLPHSRVTEAELAHVQAMAASAGLDVTEFVRQRVLKGQVSPAPSGDLAALITEVNRVAVALARIGNNVNQLALASHMDERIDRDFTRDWRYIATELRGVQDQARDTLIEVVGGHDS